MEPKIAHIIMFCRDDVTTLNAEHTSCIFKDIQIWTGIDSKSSLMSSTVRVQGKAVKDVDLCYLGK